MDEDDLKQWGIDKTKDALEFIKQLKIGKHIGILCLPVFIISLIAIFIESYLRGGNITIFDNIIVCWSMICLLTALIDTDEWMIGMSKIIGSIIN